MENEELSYCVNTIKPHNDLLSNIITRRGDKLKASFDPALISNFQDVFNDQVHRHWTPAYATDMRLNSKYDFFKIIVGRVKHFNESYDLTIVGDRGLGKSAFGLGAATIIHNKFMGKVCDFPMSHVCFDVEEWQQVCDSIASKGGGGVVILDEVGTEGSLSSRTSMSKGNRATSDIIQLMRTDRIITIYISTDRNRIDKRVRELASVMGTPIGKLSNEDTNGYGLAIEADIRYRRTRPGTESIGSGDESQYLIHEVNSLHYGPKGIVYSVVVPHPPVESWIKYGEKRAVKLAALREAGIEAYDAIGAKAAANEAVRIKKQLDKMKR